MSLGQNIKKKRQQMKLSQEYVAENGKQTKVNPQ